MWCFPANELAGYLSLVKWFEGVGVSKLQGFFHVFGFLVQAGEKIYHQESHLPRDCEVYGSDLSLFGYQGVVGFCSVVFPWHGWGCQCFHVFVKSFLLSSERSLHVFLV